MMHVQRAGLSGSVSLPGWPGSTGCLGFGEYGTHLYLIGLLQSPMSDVEVPVWDATPRPGEGGKALKERAVRVGFQACEVIALSREEQRSDVALCSLQMRAPGDRALLPLRSASWIIQKNIKIFVFFLFVT